MGVKVSPLGEVEPMKPYHNEVKRYRVIRIEEMAVVSLLNVVAELCKWPHYSHRDYLEVMENLVDEMKDENLTVYFASAERLHVNFYHNFLRRISFDVHRRNALKLIEKLKGYVSSLGVEFSDRV